MFFYFFFDPRRTKHLYSRQTMFGQRRYVFFFFKSCQYSLDHALCSSFQPPRFTVFLFLTNSTRRNRGLRGGLDGFFFCFFVFIEQENTSIWAVR